MAKIWRETGSYAALQSLGDADRIPPLLPFLIKSMMSAGIPAETAGFAINIILGSLTTLVGFGLALETTENKTIALLTAILIAVHPRINDLSTEVQRDVPYLFFSGCALWLILVGLKRKKSVLWCAAGIALAFSLLLRYEAAELLLLIPAAAFVSALFRRLSWKQALSYAAAFIACTGISFYSLLLLMGTPEFVSSYFNYIAIESICAKRQLFGTSESRGK